MLARWILPLIALVGLVFAIVVVKASNKPVPTTLPVSEPAQAPYDSYVAGAGIVEASTENMPIDTPVGGVVTKLDHWIGDKVKAGDVLFRIDPRDLDAELKVRQAALVSAGANVEATEASASEMQSQFDKVQNLVQAKVVSKEEYERRQYAAMNARAKLAQAKADVVSAESLISQTQTELDRRIIRAPVDGTVMQCKIHLGEFAQAGTVNPLLTLGDTTVLNVRVDVDENDAWRVQTDKPAVAYVRGNRDLKTNLKFVRVEPLVVPKKSLTGDSSERVDTRVLQVLYSFDPKSIPNIYVGQQMDVFIAAPPIVK